MAGRVQLGQGDPDRVVDGGVALPRDVHDQRIGALDVAKLQEDLEARRALGVEEESQ